MRVKMVVAYDGTNYSGWQIQPNGVTIEQKLNEALQALLGEDIRVTGASRTDAGVHSLGNVCIFDTDTRMPAEKTRGCRKISWCRIPAKCRIPFIHVFPEAERPMSTGY